MLDFPLLVRQTQTMNAALRRQAIRRARAPAPPPQPPTVAPRRRPKAHTLIAFATLCISLVGLAVAVLPALSRSVHLRKPFADLTAIDLVALPDADLDRLDPLVVNLIVAREIPGLESLDIDRYVKIVDHWADQIARGERAQEPEARTEALYLHDPDLWRAGGMAVAVAGPSIGIAYTADKLDAGNPSLTFVHGLIDTQRGTCSNMPVLYLAIAHRLGWPLKGVVSKDHFWCRWDDGKPGAKGGKRFNLEATSARSDGSMGSFASAADEVYAKTLETPPWAIECGSDFTSLTARQTLGVYLQARAAYWETHQDWDRAERDLLLARICFPLNREILAFQLDATARTLHRVFAQDEQRSLALQATQRTPGPYSARPPFPRDHQPGPVRGANPVVQREQQITERPEGEDAYPVPVPTAVQPSALPTPRDHAP